MHLPDNFVWFVRIAIYSAICISGFTVFIPLAISMHRNSGSCVLYARKDSSYGSTSTCNFCIANAVLFSVLYPVFFIVIGVLQTIFHKCSHLSNLKSNLFLLNVAFDGVIWFLVLVSSSIISAGLNTICDSITDQLGSTCDKVAIITPAKEKIFFYGVLSTAENAAWVNFTFWLAHLVFGVFTIYQRKPGILKNIDIKSYFPCFAQTA